jgi:hypothetical protein
MMKPRCKHNLDVHLLEPARGRPGPPAPDPGTAAVRVTARTGTPGLRSIPGTAYRERPPHTMPISHDPATIEQDSSTVISKTFTFATPVRGSRRSQAWQAVAT